MENAERRRERRRGRGEFVEVARVAVSVIASLFSVSPSPSASTAPDWSPFRIETLTALSTNRIKCRHWVNCLLDNWDVLTGENARVCIITGTHGSRKGKLKREKKFLRKDIDALKNKIKPKKRKEIADNNIKFKIVDAFRHTNSDGSVNGDKLGETIGKFRPSSVILAYCFSEISIMRVILEEAGISSSLFLHQDSMHISGKR